jgi:PhzF family phenazine biosynthesis protein
VRFFTRTGALVAGCGHGTVAVHAAALVRSGGSAHRSRLRVADRTLDAVSVRTADGIDVSFDQGSVDLRAVQDAEHDGVLTALGLPDPALRAGDGAPVLASPGAPRMLVAVADRAALRAVRPDVGALDGALRRAGLLGCFVYVPPRPGAAAEARMFAPVIGVPEDVANANSTGCLAAHLLATRGLDSLVCDQGDVLGRPCRVTASAARTRDGYRARVGGRAVVREVRTITS